MVAVFLTAQLDHGEAFFHRLGFTTAVNESDWRELRGGADSGVIGPRASETTSSSSDRPGLSFKTSDPLHDFVILMRALGYEVTEEPDPQAPHVTVPEPDGTPIEIHQN